MNLVFQCQNTLKQHQICHRQISCLYDGLQRYPIVLEICWLHPHWSRNFQEPKIDKKTWNTFVTCSWHFSRILNLRIHDFYYANYIFCLKELQSVCFCEKNSFTNIFDLNRKNLPCFKRKQEKWIRRFGIRENMSRIRYSKINASNANEFFVRHNV